MTRAPARQEVRAAIASLPNDMALKSTAARLQEAARIKPLCCSAVSSSRLHCEGTNMMISTKTAPTTQTKTHTNSNHQNHNRKHNTGARRKRDKQTAVCDKKRRSAASEPLSDVEQTRVASRRQRALTWTPLATARRPLRRAMATAASLVLLTTLLLLLLMMMLAAAGAHSSGSRRAANELAQSNHKLGLWRSLAGALYAPQVSLSGANSPETTTTEGGVKSSQIELLADKLARWPDQRRAALFFIEQLARQLESSPLARGGGFCRQISWAQLSEPASSSPPADQLAAAQHANPLARQVALDRLATSNRKLVDHLNSQPTSGRAARMALDSANLITRLLLTGQHDERRDELGSNSQQLDENDNESGSSWSFFGSLLSGFKSSSEGELASEQSGAKLNREADELLKDTRNIESLLNRLVTAKFLRYLLAAKLRESALMEPTRGRPTKQLLVHSLGVLMFEDTSTQTHRSTSSSGSLPEVVASQTRISFATIAQLKQTQANPTTGSNVKFIDWLALSSVQDNSKKSGSNGSRSRNEEGKGWRRLSELPFDGSSASFILRWLLAERSGELAKLKRRLAASLRPQMDAPDRHQVGLADGEWFSPHFDCTQDARWLLTYSAPLFARAPNGSISLRGVSFVSLDLAQSGALINQCATGGVSLLANTSECRRQLAGSQCVPLAAHLQEGAQFRPGAYACQCAPGRPHLAPASRVASAQHRKQLIELLAQGPAKGANKSHGLQQQQLDQLEQLSPLNTLESPNEADLSFIGFQAGGRDKSEQQQQRAAAAKADPLNDKRWVAQVLRLANSTRNNYSSSRPAQTAGQEAYFALGLQLELDASLEWLVNERTEPPAGSRRQCQLCKQTTDAAGGVASGADHPAATSDECQPSSRDSNDQLATEPKVDGESLAWLRPLVLSLQCVCLVITLCLICVILRIRKSRLIIVSGWLMLETMLIGAVLLHTSILVRYFQPTSLTCLLEPWFRELGFSTFYGSILIKLYRILSEFQTRKAHRVCLRDKDQIVYLLAIVFIVIGYMSAWTALMVDGFFVSSGPQIGAGIIELEGGGGDAPFGAHQAHEPAAILSRIERQIGESQRGAHHRQHHAAAVGFQSAALRGDNEKGAEFSLDESLEVSHERHKSGPARNAPGPQMASFYAILGARGLRAAPASDSTLAAPPAAASRPDHLATRVNLNAKLHLPATKELRAQNSTRSARSAPPTLSALEAQPTDADDDDDEPEAGAENSANGRAKGSRSGSPLSGRDEQQRKQQQQQQQQQEPTHLSHFPSRSSKQVESGQLAATTSSSSSSSSGSDSGLSLAGEHLEILARGLNSFGDLFLGLLESERHYEPENDTLTYLIRCRKLTWDYVTESSEIALLLFGVHLVYKLRNASMEVHKEKLILSLAIFIELLISSSLYLVRHTLWHRLTSDHLLILYSIRCQLTVTLTVALVFGPQLWQIGKSKPSLLLSALFNYSFHQYQDHSAPNCATSGASSSNEAGNGAGGSGAGSGGRGAAGARAKRAASQRHRCHISCEIHDHHLGDASRLQQAMLSNSALEIGSINLADMDPDEIQAELKRVYTQLEVLKTKVMRRDNPHISKRRGGRKPGHRKFSLQAFHNRHSSSSEHHHHAPQTVSSGNASGEAGEPSEQVGLLANTPLGRQAQQQQQQQQAQTFGASLHSTGGGRLPALAELEGESAPSCASQRSASKSSLGKRLSGGNANSAAKHVRVAETVREYSDDRANHQAHNLLNSNERSKTASLTSKLMGKAKAKKQQQQQTNSRTSAKSKWAAELPSTSSLGLEDEAMMALNDSQSSGELTPQHRSSIVCGSSYHTDEPSSIN